MSGNVLAAMTAAWPIIWPPNTWPPARPSVPVRQRVGSSGSTLHVGEAGDELVERDHRVLCSPGSACHDIVVDGGVALQLEQPRRAAAGEQLGDRSRSGSSSAEPSTVSTTRVRFSQRWNSWSVVKPMPASTCWALRRRCARRLAGERLGDRGQQRIDVVGAGVRRPRPAPSIATSDSASLCRTAWNEATDRPNCARSTRESRAASSIHRAAPISWWASATRTAAATARWSVAACLVHASDPTWSGRGAATPAPSSTTTRRR